jgi:hypothetical protein
LELNAFSLGGFDFQEWDSIAAVYNHCFIELKQRKKSGDSTGYAESR